ncbi:unnamed protein product [Cochlearia groenlandica]
MASYPPRRFEEGLSPIQVKSMGHCCYLNRIQAAKMFIGHDVWFMNLFLVLENYKGTRGKLRVRHICHVANKYPNWPDNENEKDASLNKLLEDIMKDRFDPKCWPIVGKKKEQKKRKRNVVDEVEDEGRVGKMEEANKNLMQTGQHAGKKDTAKIANITPKSTRERELYNSNDDMSWLETEKPQTVLGKKKGRYTKEGVKTSKLNELQMGLPSDDEVEAEATSTHELDDLVRELAAESITPLPKRVPQLSSPEISLRGKLYSEENHGI